MKGDFEYATSTKRGVFDVAADSLELSGPSENSAGGLTQATWWQIVVFTLVVTHITIVAVTVFLHRSQAHRGLDLPTGRRPCSGCASGVFR
ncbi:hypothetical protein BMR85_026685 [Achromobacter sp. KAs 3-5]|nr:hypothetical protein BMR85_026685 [Achromobacter sp. KAs 3-5]